MRNEFQLASTQGVCDHSRTKQTRALQGFVHSALSHRTPTTVIPDTEITAVKSAGNNTGSKKTRTRIHIREGNQQSRRVACRQQPAARRRQKSQGSPASSSSSSFSRKGADDKTNTCVCETEAEVKRAQTVAASSQTLHRACNEHHTSPRWRELGKTNLHCGNFCLANYTYTGVALRMPRALTDC